MSDDAQARGILELVEDIFARRIPFNRYLGLHVAAVGQDSVRLRLDMRDDLVGNYVRRTLHGGVISATLDTTGGLVTFVRVLQHMGAGSTEDKLERFARLGTIDLRIDYLRPGVGSFFVASGVVLRAGSRVAVTRMELHNDDDKLIAVGTGTYIVG